MDFHLIDFLKQSFRKIGESFLLKTISEVSSSFKFQNF